MKMTFRWYGSKSDHITLKQIRQIPGMSGLMGFLDYKAAGDVWTEDEIRSYIDEVHAAVVKLYHGKIPFRVLSRFQMRDVAKDAISLMTLLYTMHSV